LDGFPFGRIRSEEVAGDADCRDHKGGDADNCTEADQQGIVTSPVRFVCHFTSQRR
jgi:hypothetical protein